MEGDAFVKMLHRGNNDAKLGRAPTIGEIFFLNGEVFLCHFILRNASAPIPFAFPTSENNTAPALSMLMYHQMYKNISFCENNATEVLHGKIIL